MVRARLRRPVGVRGSRPRHERIPGRAGQRLGLVRQVGEPVVHRLACLVRRSAGRERTAAALPGRAANRSATGTSRRRSRASPSARRTVTGPVRNPARASSEGPCPGPSRTCVPSGHLQPPLAHTSDHGRSWVAGSAGISYLFRTDPGATRAQRGSAPSGRLAVLHAPGCPAVRDPDARMTLVDLEAFELVLLRTPENARPTTTPNWSASRPSTWPITPGSASPAR